MTEKIYETYSPEETHALGKRLGAEAKPGDVYTLVGDLASERQSSHRNGGRTWHHGAGLQPDLYNRAGI